MLVNVLDNSSDGVEFAVSIVAVGIACVGVLVRSLSYVSAAVVTVCIAITRENVADFSDKVTAFIVTGIIASVIENVADLASEVTALHVAVCIANVIGIEDVFYVLPLSYESDIVFNQIKLEIPCGSEIHPGNDLVTVLCRNAGSYQLGTGCYGFCFKNNSGFRFKGNGSGILAATRKAKCQRGQT